jgi:hypothetical protein
MSIAEYHTANIAAWLRRTEPKLPEPIVQMRAAKIHNMRINGLKAQITLETPVKKNNVKSYIY